MTIELRLEPISDEALSAISRANPGYRFERSAEGKLIVSPTGLFPSGGEGELHFQVLTWVKSTQLGRAFPATGGLTLPDTAVKSPDTTYVTNERLAALTPLEYETAYTKVVPDVAFELMSPNDDLEEAKEKVENYIQNGVRAGVLINPRANDVSLLRPGMDWVKHATPSVEIGPEMPGFVLDAVAVIYESKRGPV